MPERDMPVASLAESAATLLAADMPQSDKLDSLHALFLKMLPHGVGSRKGLGALLSKAGTCAAGKGGSFTPVIDWMFSLEDVPDEKAEKYCELGELLSAASEDGNAWIVFKRLRVQFLMEHGCIDEAIPKIEELAELLPNDKEIQDMAQKHKKQSQGAKVHMAQNPRKMPVQTEKNRIPTGCDNEFYALVGQLKSNTLDQLLTNAATHANRWLDEDHEYYGSLLKWYRIWYHVGLFGQDKGFINYFGSMYQYLKQHLEDIIWLYEELVDYRSKLTLKIILQHWMTLHPDLRKFGREVQFMQYFDLDVIKCDENEVFVDCGCYDGNTVKEFIQSYGPRYKSIYSYELTPASYEMAKANLKDVPRLYLRNAGVSDKTGQFPFLKSPDGTSQGANRLNANGNAIARVVRLDDDIQEDVTFIKMDVEGAECDALHGAEQQIRRNKPKLAISLYHKLPDLVELPRLIRSYVPEYKLYLRHYFDGHRQNDFPFPSEYVIFATM